MLLNHRQPENVQRTTNTPCGSLKTSFAAP